MNDGPSYGGQRNQPSRGFGNQNNQRYSNQGQGGPGGPYQSRGPGGFGGNNQGQAGPNRPRFGGPPRGQGGQGGQGGQDNRFNQRPNHQSNNRNDDRQSDRPPPIEILHLDEHFVVIKKPVGVQTAAIRSRQATALDITREELKSRRERNLRVFTVHEIDKDASGVLVFARTDEATIELRRQFRSRVTDRMYLALIEADLPTENVQPVTIRSRIIENRRGVAETVPDQDAAPTGPDKPLAAVTHVRTVASLDGLTLVRIRAETDHAYQLRAHMSEAGTPVAGDRAYRTRRKDIPRLALHLSEVAFEHPITQKKIRFASIAPAPFYELVGKTAPDGAPVARSIDAEGKSQPTHWDSVSEWYDDLLNDRGSDLYQRVLIPGTMRMLGNVRSTSVLDIACGQGILSRALAERGAQVVGIDGAPRLIQRARELTSPDHTISYGEGDAQALEPAIKATVGEEFEPFDSAVCLMALMNIEDLEASMRSASCALKPGGSFVGVILHPAFRAPRQTSWGWLGAKPESQKQFRRIDSYMSVAPVKITMNPGAAASGKDAITTTTFNRPISEYMTAAAKAGLFINGFEEWISPRESQPGPRADEENRARREFPMFLAFRAVRTETVENQPETKVAIEAEADTFEE